jgi:hypothetical protein
LAAVVTRDAVGAPEAPEAVLAAPVDAAPVVERLDEMAHQSEALATHVARLAFAKLAEGSAKRVSCRSSR